MVLYVVIFTTSNSAFDKNCQSDDNYVSVFGDMSH